MSFWIQIFKNKLYAETFIHDFFFSLKQFCLGAVEETSLKDQAFVIQYSYINV